MANRTTIVIAAALVSPMLVVGLGTSGPASAVHPGTHPASAQPATSAAATAAVDWPQYHNGPTHLGVNRDETVVGRGNVSSLSLSWIGNGSTSQEDLVYRSSPTVVDGFVYFGTDAGQLLAFPDHCASECEPAWRLQLGEGIYNTPAVVHGILYVGTASPLGHLYAFDVKQCAATHGGCSPLWTAPLGIGDSSVTVAGGVVFVGSQVNNIYAFDAGGCGKATCKPLWIGHTDGYVLNSPAVANGVVYAGDATGYLYAFDANGCSATAGTKVPTCTADWRGKAANPIYDASPVVHGGMVYTTSFGADPDSYLEVFAADGCAKKVCKPVWRGLGGGYMNGGVAIAYGRVYTGGGDGVMRVYPAKGCGNPTCPALWTGFGSGPVAAVESPPMVANGVVYIGMEQRIRAFDAKGCGQAQCDPVWEFITQDPIVNSSPVLVNGTLYFSGTNFGAVPELYVFDLA